MNETDKKKERELAELLKNLIPRLMLYTFLTDSDERSVKDIVDTIDEDVFKDITQLSLIQFKLLMGDGNTNPIYDPKDLDNEIRHFASAMKKQTYWWDEGGNINAD
jgi:hypothetical protein